MVQKRFYNIEELAAILGKTVAAIRHAIHYFCTTVLQKTEGGTAQNPAILCEGGGHDV